MPSIGTFDQLEQARSSMGELNKKIIDPVPEKMLKSGKPIKIYNVGPWTWMRPMGSLGTFTIPACPKGELHSKALEIPYIVRETIPHESSNWKLGNRFEDGANVALAILGEGPFQAKEHGFRRFGVFIAAGDEPTTTEIAEAEACLLHWREQQVAEADAFWNQGPNHYQFIVGEHRDAANALGIERDWLKPIKPMMECPGCGVRINPAVSKHSLPHGCGRIVNKVQYIQEWKDGLWPGDPNPLQRPA